LADAQLCFAAPTNWVMTRIRQSSLFGSHRVELIPYPIDTNTFRPFDQRVARDLLRLPFDKKIIFFGATYLEDRRKGMSLLVDALRRLAALLDGSESLRREDLFLLVAGLQGQRLLDELPFAGKYAGHFNDDLTLALAYQAADLFVCPSVEDAGPMMIPEAMMCGTPVAAFNAGGAPDLIETMKTGYLARLADPEDLALGMLKLLAADNGTEMRVAAHETATRAHRPESVARRYLQFCESLLAAVER